MRRARLRSRNHHDAGRVAPFQFGDADRVLPEQALDDASRIVATLQMDDLRRPTEPLGEVEEIGIGRDNGVPMLECPIPDQAVIGLPQSNVANVDERGKERREPRHELGGEVLVEEHGRAAGQPKSAWRPSSAAKR